MQIKGFMEWVNETLLNEVDLPTVSQGTKFNFNFESGRYAMTDITPDKSAQLVTDLRPILAELNIPKLIDSKTTITITASTSTLGLAAATLANLTAAGFPAKDHKFNGNDALCAARLATIEEFIISAFTKALRIDKAGLLSKLTIIKKSLPNSGSGKTDEERKKYQYISAEVVQTGEQIPPDQKLICMQTFNGKGEKAGADVNYVGFRKDLYIIAIPGRKITLKFNPLQIPDMVYFKYRDRELLSPWLGAKTQINPPFDWVKILNSTFLDLEEKINAELKSCGSTGTVATLRPNAKVNGKWVVYPGPQQSGGKSETFTFPLEKSFDKDQLIVRCFSPLGGTLFTVEMVCDPIIATK